MSVRLLFAVLLALFSFTAANGQTGVANGSIRGIVQDPNRAAVGHADIAARNLDTGFERRAATNNEGEFDVPLLPLGRYEVTVTSPGFASFTQSGVVVTLARSSDLTVGLKLASSQQNVTVEADASILTTDNFSVGDAVNQKSMENLPLPSRNTYNFALFAPGFNGTRDNEFGNPTFAFGGIQRRAFLVDGIDNTQRGGPGRLGIFSPETIQETRVISNAMAAEYGRTVGGIVSFVTRGGTNDLHGEVLVLERRPGFIARPSLAPTNPFSQWTTYSGNVGGRIIKDKLWYFASGEYEPLDGPRAITISPANALALKIPASDLGSAPFAQRFQTYLGRIDYQLNAKNSFFVRYSNFVTPSKFNTSGGLSPKSASNNFDDRNDTGATQWTSIISPNTVNEFRFGALQREFTRPPVSGIVSPVVSISGVVDSLFSNSSANQYYRERQFDFIETLNHRRGSHSLKFGFDIATIEVISSDRLAQTYSFASLSQYLNTLAGVTNPATGRPFNYTQLTEDFGNNVARHRTNSYNFYAQDDYQIRPNLTLSYGLRYEFLAYPSLDKNAPLPASRGIRSDPYNFAPRFGFAWLPNSKTVVRGGYGLFYDTTNLRLISQAIRQNGSNVLRYVVAGTDPAAPQYPAGLPAPSASFGVKPSVTNFAPDYKQLHTSQTNLQVERALGNDFSVTVATQYYGGRHLPVLIDRNLGAPVRYLADGRPVFSNANRPNQAFNQILQLSSIANSTYYGGFVAVSKRFSRGLQFTASYTLGYAFNTNDSTGDAGSSPTDSTNLKRDYGLSSSDQRHRFVLQGVWQPRVRQLSGLAGQVVNGWMVSPNVTWTSGFPINAVSGSDLNGDSVNNDRPLYRGRNDTPGYGFQEVNLRLSRTFRLGERFSVELIGEAENLFNSLNVACTTGGCSGAVVNNANAPDFRRITGAFDSRQIQVGGRLRF